MARPRSIDYDQVACASRHGLPDTIIAERLQCSVRSVRRARKDAGEEVGTADIDWGTASEWRLWRCYIDNLDYTPGEIAHAFCRTRQAVYAALKRLKAIRRVGGIAHRYPAHQSPTSA